MLPARCVSVALSLAIGVALLAAPPVDTSPPSGECSITPDHWASPATRWSAVSRTTAAVSADSSAARRRPLHREADPILIRSFVDDEIFGTMKGAGITPTRLTTDAEFLRRVSLDLTGAIPNPSAIRAFVSDTSPGKRAAKIDELLLTDGYVDRWTLWFGDLVQNVRFSAQANLYNDGRNAYYQWIQSSFRQNKAYDVMVRELVAANGNNFQSGAANYIVRQIQRNGPPQDTYDNLAASTVQKFMGIPFECLSCHGGPGHLELVNSYLSTREREEFWGMAAFFARVAIRPIRTDGSNQVSFQVEERPRGEYQLNTTTGNKSPREPLPGEQPFTAPRFIKSRDTAMPGESRREAFGRIMTADRQFARNTVNSIWRELFHLGIVEPSDSFDLLRLDPDALQPGATLQPTHPVLLERLTDTFIDSGYDLQALMRLLTASSAYQLATEYTPGEWNETWTPFFARHYTQRLHAEILLDAIGSATLVPAVFPLQGSDVPLVGAIKLPDPLEGGRRNPHGSFLDAFGRGDRDDTPRTSEGSILQALNLLNSPIVTQRVSASRNGSAVQQALRFSTDPAVITEFLYLSTLSRFPTDIELAIAVESLQSTNRNAAAEDLQFSLINRLEFMFN